MAGRIELGSAEYNFVANDTQLLSAFTRSEAAARQSTAAVASAVNAQAKAVAAAGTNMERAYTKVAEVQVRAAQRSVEASKVASKAFNDQLEAAKKAQNFQPAGGGGGRGGALGNLGQLAIVAAGGGLIGGGAVQAAHLLNTAISDTAATAVKADQVQRNLNVTFGQTSMLYRDIAAQAATYAGVSTRAAQEVTGSFGSLNKNYGFTSKQIGELTKLTLDYAAATGKDAVDVSHRLEAALRGEAESAEILGLTLNSDAVKAMANMTDAQRKNFETLDQVTKAQIIYRELMRQSANVIGEATKNNQSLAGATTQLAGSWEELVIAFGKAGESEFAAIARGAKLTIDAIRELIKAGDDLAEQEARRAAGGSTRQSRANDLMAESAGLRPSGGTSPTGGRLFGPTPNEIKAAGTAAAQAAEDIKVANQAAEASARTLLQTSQATFKGISDLREEALAGQKKAVQEDAAAQKQVIEDTRDKDINASQERLRATLSDLDTRQQAASDYFKNEISNLESARDADIAAAQDRKQATLDAIEAERDALASARVTEDRAIEDRRASERAGIEAAGSAAEAQVNAEIEGINKTKDAAIEAIDDRIAAEDRRHEEALRNLQREEDAALGIIDAQLDAIDKAAETERRADTDRELKHNLSVAKQDRKSAETPQEKALARNAVTKAQNAIDKEARDRTRADLRDRLRDQQDAIRKDFAARKQAETDKTKLEKGGLEERKTAVEEAAENDVKAWQTSLTAFKEGQQGQLASLEARYKDEDRQREDNRKLEDKALDDRKTAVERSSADEITAIKNSYNARIDSLRDQATASDRYYANEKTKANDAARLEQAKIKEVADFHLRALAKQTDDTIAYLDRMGKEWENFSTRVQNALKAALGNIKGYLSGAIKVEFTVAASGTGSRYVPGTDAGSIPSGLGESTGQLPFDPSRRNPSRGELIRGASSRDGGGPMEPGQLYKVHKDEYIIPRQSLQAIPASQVRTGDLVPNVPNMATTGRGRRVQAVGSAGGVTLSITNNVDGRGVQNVHQLAELVTAQTTLKVVSLLAQAERNHAEAAPADLGRSN